jgi:hypothetical protein
VCIGWQKIERQKSEQEWEDRARMELAQLKAKRQRQRQERGRTRESAARLAVEAAERKAREKTKLLASLAHASPARGKVRNACGVRLRASAAMAGLVRRLPPRHDI